MSTSRPAGPPGQPRNAFTGLPRLGNPRGLGSSLHNLGSVRGLSSSLRGLGAGVGRLLGLALATAGARAGARAATTHPDVELAESDDGWVVVARLPGVAPEEVAIEVDDRELHIRGRSEEEVNAEQGMPGTGSRLRGFEHRVRLPARADLDRMDAVMDHGLLTVAVPRTPAAGRRAVTVGRRTRASAGVPGGPAVTPDTGTDTDRAVDRELHQPDVGTRQPARRRFG